VRNPLYLGTFVAWASIAPILNIYGAATVLTLLTLRGLRLITYEERELPAKFGQAYLDWKR
jgi:protein-S-isoprenylcysteine O-methyltransferase Ste14